MSDSLPTLVRPQQHAMVAGVCAGLAQRWRIDPTVLRVIMAALAFAGGLGVALYVAGVVTIPREGSSDVAIHKLLPFTRSWPAPAVAAAVAAVLVAAFWATNLGPGIGTGAVVVVVVLVAGFVLSRRTTTNAATRSNQPEPTPFERQAEAWRQRLAENQGVVVPANAPGTSPATPPPGLPGELVPASARPRSHGWRIAFALMAVGIGVLAVLAIVGLPIPPVAYAAAILVSLGVGLLSGVRARRPRGLMPVTLIMAIITAGMMMGQANPPQVVAAAPQPVPIAAQAGQGGFAGQGDTQVFTQESEIPPAINYGAGSVDLDFSQLTLTRDASTSIDMSMGQVTISLPKNTNYSVDWSVDAGSFSAGGDTERSGLRLSGTEQASPITGKPTLRLTVHVGAGNLDVTS